MNENLNTRINILDSRPDIVLILLVRRLAHPPADDAEHVLDGHHALEGKLVYSLARMRFAQLPAEKSLGSSVTFGMIKAQLQIWKRLRKKSVANSIKYYENRNISIRTS